MLKDGLTETEQKLLSTPLGAARGNSTLQSDIVRINDKRISAIRAENKNFRAGRSRGVASVISDDLGLQGIINHADGRTYDSKSDFRKATRRAGCVEVGTEKPKEWKTPLERGVQGDFNVAPALKEALQRHGVK